MDCFKTKEGEYDEERMNKHSFMQQYNGLFNSLVNCMKTFDKPSLGYCMRKCELLFTLISKDYMNDPNHQHILQIKYDDALIAIEGSAMSFVDYGQRKIIVNMCVNNPITISG